MILNASSLIQTYVKLNTISCHWTDVSRKILVQSMCCRSAKSYDQTEILIWLSGLLKSRVQLKRDGTRRRTGGEVTGKLANAVGSQYLSHYLGTWCIHHYYLLCAHLGWQYSTELTPPADLNGLVRFVERRNLISAHVPSHFKRSLQ
jgi:hypothetical protein